MAKTKHAPAHSKAPPPNLDLILSAVLFAFAMGHYLWAISIGWGNTITDHHAFRQTQTAISALFMLKGPLTLAYETPILGAPWPIPFEFPLYQWLTVAGVKLFGLGLEQSGRLVGVTAYLLTLIPACYALRWLKVSVANRLLWGTLLLISPFYSFWSRTFMIETLAVLMGFSYAACLLPALESRRWWPALGAVCFGALAALVKITTFLPFAVIPIVFWVKHVLENRKQKLPFTKLLSITAWDAMLSAIPALCGILWTRYSDSIKEQNPLGHFLTSAQLSKWNFGDLVQKTSGVTWTTILGRTPTVLCSPAIFWTFLVLALVSLLVFRKRWKESALAAGLFLLAPAVFTNLHFIHDYYMCANGVLMLSAIGFAMVGFSEGSRKHWIAVVIVGGLTVAAATRYSEYYKPVQEQNATNLVDFGKKVQAQVAEDEVNVFLGFDWDSTVPYYTQRRALMIPDWTYLTEDAVQKAVEGLKTQKIGLIFVRQPSRVDPRHVLELMKAAGVRTDRVVTLR